MKTEVENKLDKIANIWNHYIWDYKYCNSKIKFTTDVRSNYFGDILGYFKDTFQVVSHENRSASYPDQFSYHISLLQAIYVHQDFIEELLIIFRTNILKGNLKKDENYSINRGIRNELVGHPIRKINEPTSGNEIVECGECGKPKDSVKKKSVLLSSTLFGYHTNRENLVYMRYHRDNNYEYEKMSYSILEIIDRHNTFLNTYFDIILTKLKSIVELFCDKLNSFETKIKTLDFPALLRLTSDYYEYIFVSDHIFDKESLLTIYAKRKEHERYQCVIDNFYEYLISGVKTTQQEIKELFTPKEVGGDIQNLEPPKPIKITYVSREDVANDKEKNPVVTYHYELGKLYTKRNSQDFDFFGDTLRSKCETNTFVCEELDHMENNISNKIEYYSALTLIQKILTK
ncbi:MAG: hypothetical protein P8P29_04090 [Flavobacteriaceae bacterium]|nr:hypothetical protein [Flavobacteriaceae bacterium]